MQSHVVLYRAVVSALGQAEPAFIRSVCCAARPCVAFLCCSVACLSCLCHALLEGTVHALLSCNLLAQRGLVLPSTIVCFSCKHAGQSNRFDCFAG